MCHCSCLVRQRTKCRKSDDLPVSGGWKKWLKMEFRPHSLMQLNWKEMRRKWDVSLLSYRVRLSKWDAGFTRYFTIVHPLCWALKESYLARVYFLIQTKHSWDNHGQSCDNAGIVVALVLQFAVVSVSQRGGSSLCSVADFELDISMIHAWCDGWPGDSQNLYWDRTRLRLFAWPERLIRPQCRTYYCTSA